MQIFHRSTNTLSKVSIFGAVFVLGFVTWVFARLDRSGYNTGQDVTLAQPVPFSHDHHTVALGIDCRYCHTSVETAAMAGVPPTQTCMNCHAQIWTNAELLEPVRASLRERRPIAWERVHDLPDFVYFDHSIHVAKGVGCAECHGRVDEMPLVWRTETLQMEWCLDCHRDPEPRLRPRSEITNVAWEPPADRRELGAALAHDYDVRARIDCTVCHR